MSTEPKIIILRGNSGSGKTTIAKKLQKNFGKGTFLISQDVVRREQLYVSDGAKSPAIDLLIHLIKYAKENCEIIILEGILYSDWYRPLFEVVKKEFSCEIYAYYFDIPFEETLIRHKTRSKTSDFGEGEMSRWWREKDYIEMIPETIIDENMPEDTIVQTVRADVLKTK